MPRYSDETETLTGLAGALRLEIARRIALEAGAPVEAEPTEAQIAAADTAIADWECGGEEVHDPAAFRPLGPLQQLLSHHNRIVARLADLLDRRIS